MGQAAAINDSKPHRSGTLPGSGSFEKLQELTRHGYLPDTQPVRDGDGILLRHDSAPDLILWADGTVDVPLGQPAKSSAVPAPTWRRKRRWGRALLIFSFLLAYSFISFVVMVNFIAE